MTKSASNTSEVDGDKKTSGAKRFQEQCYLLWNWSVFQKNNQSVNYENFVILMGQPSDVINKLVAKRGVEALFELKPYQISALVPKIRLFKVSYANSTEGETQEIKFNDHTSAQSIENITKTRLGRGDGVGIKSFNYDLQGGSARGGAALVKKGVTKVNLTFLFQNLEMLIQREPGQAALIDLLTHPPAESEKAPPTCAEGGKIDFSNVFDAKKFAIKVVYGWAEPEGDLIPQEIKSVLRGSSTTLLLNLQRHELDFKQDGTVEVNTEYMGYSDSVMTQPSADIFWIDEKRSENMDMKKADITSANDELNKVKKELEDAKKVVEEEGAGVVFNTDAEDKVESIQEEVWKQEEDTAEKKEELNEADAANKIFVYQRLLSALQNSQKIYFIDLNKEQLDLYNEEVSSNAYNAGTKGGTKSSEDVAKLSPDEKVKYEAGVAAANKGAELKPQVATDTPIESMNEVIENAIEDSVEEPGDLSKELEEFAKEELATTARDPDSVRINYFYYGDLLDIAFSVLSNNKEAENVRALIGPISFVDPASGNKTIISLADIPIALNKFLEWYSRNVIATQRQEYLLGDFVRDTIKDLIHSALGEGCFEGAGYPAPEPKVSMQVISVPGSGPAGKEDRIPKGVGRIHINDVATNPSAATIPSSEYQDVSKLHQYVYIYAYSWSQSNLNGDPVADAERGIYHLNIGSDKGLVKSISFSRIDQPALAAHRATSTQCDLRHLRELYKVNIDMVGNALFAPGQILYVNPSVMGIGDPQLRASLVDALGLGGYYVVNKVAGSLTRSGFKTTVEAWLSGGKNSNSGGTIGTSTNTAQGGSPTESTIDSLPGGIA